jgi:DNA processing protein
VISTTIGQLVGDRRSLERRGQQKLDGAPFVAADRPLWCAGDLSLASRACLAVVGTRDASEQGVRRARKLARELVARDVVIVSGLARGVDVAALREAIDVGGKVIAVIGTPIDRAYPIEHASLQEEIARDHLLISQFPAGTRTYPSHFPERNRVMAAISDATAIIEAGDTSGTLHQAAECVHLHRWLFIAKNVVDNPALEWPSRFRTYERMRILNETSDIELVLLQHA